MQLAVKRRPRCTSRARASASSEITADMLVKGTKKRDAVALAKAIDFVGGTIAADATFEATLVSCSVLARNLGTCLELVPEMITQPSVPRRRARQGARADGRQRPPAARRRGHARRRRTCRTSCGATTTCAAGSTASRRSRRSGATTSSRGTRRGSCRTTRCSSSPATSTPRSSRPTSSARSAAWKKAPVPPAPSYKEPGLSGSRIRLVDKPGQTQTHIRIAQFGIKHDDPRFFDTLVWNYVLGGGAFSSRLMKVVRVEGGKTYGASSSFDRNLDKGSFVAQTFTRNAEAVATDEADARRDREDGEGRADAGRGRRGDREHRRRLRHAVPVGGRCRRGADRRRAARLRPRVPDELSRSRSARSTSRAAKQAAAEILDPRST